MLIGIKALGGIFGPAILAAAESPVTAQEEIH
jgi:hypothetical protein